jgi:secreted PhoX family phosphatase
MTTRRDFLKSAGLYTAGFIGLRELVNRPTAAATATGGGAALGGRAGFGALVDDPAGLFQLPKGFRYTRFGATGDEMADGLLVPGKHDGMAAFAGENGRTLLVCNHEIKSAESELGAFGKDLSRLGRIDRAKIYDYGKGIAPHLGGTTTLVFDTRTQRLERQFLSLAGTTVNCAGGPTPWGTWVTCEEVGDTPEAHSEQAHGYNFEVRPTAQPALADPLPLKAMGRFRHEAVAVDPASGIVYQTEDVGDGLLYRFIPKEPGKLAAGGKLQAMAVRDRKSADTRNWKQSAFPIGQRLAVEWIDMEEIDNPKGDLRLRGAAAGAAIFARGEGAWWGNDSVYFAMTNGGRNASGQIFRYFPSVHEGTARESATPGFIELFAEPNDTELLRNCDNVTVAPWGDLIICEDADAICRIVGITPRGEYYVIGSNTKRGRELCGACFSPDGTTLFVNVQNPGYTLAITGPWGERRG